MIRVLIIDDSAVTREVLAAELGRVPGIDVAGVAADAYVARDKIIRLRPDVITLDIEMPRMNGLTFLAKLMKYCPLPVIIVSSTTPKGGATAVRALELGAFEVVAKPGPGHTLSELTADLADSIRAAACSRPVRPNADELREPGTALRIGLPTTTEQVLAIGASTGGTDAIRYVLTRLPPLTPGTVIVQHMPAYVTAAFAERLNGLCAMEVREARSGDAVQPGVALIAPGGRHMRLRRGPGGYRIDITKDPPVYRQRPSVDVLFHSVAECAGRNATGVILTGMGADGAEGLLAMKQAGAHTLAQDEASCVVFGMPKEAIRLGATEHVVPLKRMPERILQTFAGKRTHAVAGSQP